jgi:hypothetical protein
MTTTIRRTTVGAIAMALAIAGLLAALAVSGSAAALKHFDAKVLSKDGGSKTFKANTEQRGIVKFHVNGSTDFERIKGGFSGLDKGLRVEVTAKHTSNGWLARNVERRRHNG